MKKLFFCLLMGFSVGSFATSSMGINWNSWDIDGTTVDGAGVMLSGNNGSFIYDVDIFKLSAGGDDLTANVTELGYAFGDSKAGAVFIGFQSADSDINGVSRATDAQIGWVKRGGDGTQIKLSVVGDEDNSVLGDFQFPMGNGFFELGLWNNDGDTLWRIGYSWKF